MANAEQRYWAKIDKSGGEASCWPWTAARNRKGYPIFVPTGKARIATRWGWEQLNGPIPEKHFVCHTCDNPPCMNPSHWFLGTAAKNNADRDAKQRQARGDRHGRRTSPKRTARGERHGTRTKPGSLASGDEHYARARPDLLVRGESHGRARLTEAIIRDIRARHSAGERTHTLAAEYGIARSTVRRIAARTAWKHVE